MLPFVPVPELTLTMLEHIMLFEKCPATLRADHLCEAYHGLDSGLSKGPARGQIVLLPVFLMQKTLVLSVKLSLTRWWKK